MKKEAQKIIEEMAEIYFPLTEYHLPVAVAAGKKEFIKIASLVLTSPELLQAIRSDEWVNVSEKLPELEDVKYASVNVLAATNGYVRELYYRRDEVRKQVLFRWHTPYGLHYGEVTHWQPLPLPPNK